MAHDKVQAAMDRLHAAPLEAFVAERTRLAKELRAGGERSAAEEVAKLPKPTAAAWALNHVAREQPDAVGDWLEAASVLRDASTHPAEAGGDELRGAMAAHRAATARLTEVVRDRAQPGGRPLSEAMLDRVRTLLHSATADARVAEHLRAGRMTEGPAPTDIAADVEPPSERTAVKAHLRSAKRDVKRESEPPSDRTEVKAQRRSAKRDAEVKARAERRATLERRMAAAAEQVERLREEAARREEGVKSADESLEEARRTLRRAESEAAAANVALKDAEEAVTAGEHELHELRALLRRAGG